MSNSCITKITISHENGDELKKLESLIKEWTNEDTHGYGHAWLGNVVIGSGIGTVNTGTSTDVLCRGDLTHISFSGNDLVVEIDYAWSPKLHMWRLLLEKYLPDATLVYNTEVDSTLWTNDPDLEGVYCIDPWDIETVDYDDAATTDTVVEVLQKLLKTEISSLDELLEIFEDSEYPAKMSVREWEYSELADWD